MSPNMMLVILLPSIISSVLCCRRNRLNKSNYAATTNLTFVRLHTNFNVVSQPSWRLFKVVSGLDE
jgi:hypothetical protein